MIDPHKIWNAVVIGAGPAGSVAATLLARRGLSVLLVERAKWPRDKVCGGCLNASAIASLHRLDLSDCLTGSALITKCRIAHAGRNLILPRSTSAAIARESFDAALVRCFLTAGGTFLHNTTATVLPPDSSNHRHLILRTGQSSSVVTARYILACDGLAGTSLANESWARWHISPTGWIGVAATLSDVDAIIVSSNEITMQIGSHGYAGLVRYRNGDIHLAAAVAGYWCRTLGGPTRAVRQIFLQAAGIDLLPALNHARFHGTPILTRRRANLAAHRILTLGDAASYVEPFTGEGISWAIDSAVAAADFLHSLQGDWHPDTSSLWTRRHTAMILRRQRLCRTVRWTLHHPLATRLAMTTALTLPNLANRLASWTDIAAIPAAAP